MTSEHLIQFQNRLKKMNAHLGKWARRQNITCYRIYDCDVPGFDYSIDRYEDHIYLCEFSADKRTDTERAELLNEVIACIEQICLVPKQRIHFKSRQIQKGGTERELGSDDVSEQGDFIVNEGGHRFLVDLDCYLDTGLFLDHRKTRSMVEADAIGKRFLNLFCYTGSFTIYAASGGAASTVSVDLSKTYCEWLGANLELNDLSRDKNKIVNADVMRYLKQEKAQSFDLIVLDPPTFSNSKKMQATLDIKKDHPALIKDALRVCATGGTIYFSCNLRNFKLKQEEIIGCEILDISKQTIPNDFRDLKIHHCYKIKKTAQA